MIGPQRVLRRYRKIVAGGKGLLLLGVIGICGGYLTRSVLLPAWSDRGFVYVGSYTASDLLGTDPLIVVLLPVGLYLGTALVWFLDSYKRYQAVLLWFGIGVVAAALWLQGKLIPEVLNASVLVLFFFGVYLLCGAVMGGFPILGLALDGWSALGRPPYEFAAAPTSVFIMTELVVAVGLVEAHLAYNPVALSFGGLERMNLVLPNLVALVGLMAALGEFTRYDTEFHTVQLGPERAGKSAMFGGLYDAAITQGATDLTIRGSDEEAAVKGLRADIQAGEFPDRNRVQMPGDEQSVGILRIEYVSDDRLFRTRNVLFTIDYPGEALIGNDGEGEEEKTPSVSDVLAEEYWDDSESDDGMFGVFERVRQLFSPRTSDDDWEAALETVENVYYRQQSSTASVDEKEITEAIAAVVHEADRVLLTVPMDDFPEPLAARRTEQLYTEIVRVETLSSGQAADRVDTEFDVRVNPPLREPVKGTITNGEFVPAGDAELGFELDVNRLKPYDTGSYYYVINQAQRQSPKEYIGEYREIATHGPYLDTKEFIWVPTMSDLVQHDFREVYNRCVERNPSEFEEALPLLPYPPSNYKLFARWIEEEFIDVPGFADLRDVVGDEFVYPVWYDIEDDAPPGEEYDLTIETDHAENAPILRGAQYLLDRIEGKQLVERTAVSSLVWGNESSTAVERRKREMDRAVGEVARRRRESASEPVAPRSGDPNRLDSKLRQATTGDEEFDTDDATETTEVETLSDAEKSDSDEPSEQTDGEDVETIVSVEPDTQTDQDREDTERDDESLRDTGPSG